VKTEIDEYFAKPHGKLERGPMLGSFTSLSIFAFDLDKRDNPFRLGRPVDEDEEAADRAAR
jgi:hypothetical protein